MSQRRAGHRKSRNGCLRCKARRVKCDEKRPCTNCIRYEIVCSLEVSGAPTPKSLSSPTTTSGDAGLDMGTVVAASAPTPVYRHSGHSTAVIVASSPHLASRDSRQTNRDALFLRSQSSQEPNSYYSPEWILSLRLFHHWCTSVYLTFSKDPATREIWGNAVPEMACNNELLLHSILAISALHYAHSHPEERRDYQIKSAVYQDMALRDYSERLRDINEANCEALFLVASCIFKLTMHSISSPQEGEQPLVPSDVARFFIVVQGIRRILDFKPIERWAKEGPLAPMMMMYEIPPLASTGSFSRRMDKLTALAREQRVSFEVINPQSACLLAIESLRSTHALAVRDRSLCASHGLWIWIISLPSLFIDMMSNNSPVALVILAHYAAVLRPYERDDWVFAGWSSSVMGAIERALEGQDRLLTYIAWPKHSVEAGIDVDDMRDEEGAMLTS